MHKHPQIQTHSSISQVCMVLVSASTQMLIDVKLYQLDSMIFDLLQIMIFRLDLAPH